MQNLLLQNAHDVFFTHDQDFLAIDLDGLAGVLAEQNAIAHLDVQGDLLAVVVALARNRFAQQRFHIAAVADAWQAQYEELEASGR